MNKLQKLKNLQKFKSLPEEMQLLYRWMHWVDFDKKITGNIETSIEFINFKLWFINELKWEGIEKNILPPLGQSEHISEWFYLTDRVNTDALKSINPENNYVIRKRFVSN